MIELNDVLGSLDDVRFAMVRRVSVSFDSIPCNSTYHLLRPSTLIVFVIDIVSPLFVCESVPRFFLLLSIHPEEAHRHQFSLLDFTGWPLFLEHLSEVMDMSLVSLPVLHQS